MNRTFSSGRIDGIDGIDGIADTHRLNGIRRYGRIAVAAIAGSVILALSGCATPPKPLYDWEGYQPQVYEYFKGESKEAQIIALERDLEKIKASNHAAPPGYHAHLGLLYASVGKSDKMVEEFQIEKQLFPESASYIDFLLKNKTPEAKQ